MDGDGFQLERDAAVATGASAFANLLCDVVGGSSSSKLVLKPEILQIRW
jgi:hypothetical protein